MPLAGKMSRRQIWPQMILPAAHWLFSRNLGNLPEDSIPITLRRKASLMSVLKSSISSASGESDLAALCELDEASQTLAIHLGRRRQIDDPFLVRFRDEISRQLEVSEVAEIIFDLAGIFVLSSSTLGLIASLTRPGVKVRVINVSKPARDDFQLTGLYRIVELEPPAEPPAK